MSARVVVLLDGTQLAIAQGGAAPVLRTWDVADADGAAASVLGALRARGGAHGRARVLLVLGGAWLQVARATLPPVPPEARRRMLRLESDRVFATDTPQATTLMDPWAFGAGAALVTRLARAFGAHFDVDAVLALPCAVAWASRRAPALNGTWWHAGVGAEPDTPREAAWGQMLLQVRDGTVRDARVGLLDAADRAAATPLPVTVLLAALAVGPTPPFDLQLADAAREAAWRASRQRAWWRTGALTAAALLLLGWGVDRWRARVERTLEAHVARVTRESEGARAAQQRLLTARAEQAQLAAGNASPLGTLAQLAGALPPDAWVQRLTWEADRWRIEGSARDVAALVPALTSRGFRDVQSLAPSLRFVDAGQPRGSFTLGFTVQPDSAARPVSQPAAPRSDDGR